MDFGTDIINKKDDERQSAKAFIFNNDLVFPYIKGTQVYLVSIKYFSNDEEQPSKRLDYKIALRSGESKKSHSLAIEKFDFFINNQEPNLIIEQLFDEINKTIYPVHLDVNKYGAIETISNLEDIKSRWEKKKTKLKQQTTGKTFYDTCRAFEKLCSNPVKFEMTFEKDLFFSLFFNSFYKSYDKKENDEKLYNFPIIPYAQPLQYKGSWVLKSKLSKFETLKLNFSGNHKSDLFESDLDIVCHLNPELKLPEILTASCFLEYRNTKQTKTVEVSIARSQDHYSDLEAPKIELEQKEVKKNKKWPFNFFK
ncbi:hypothetical protein [Aequorivita capsosiphonis]|uniref:hypothetical protein n=1 Tax=Aequorivita capsosiphonis TaxID=487317 RepID=UPI0003FE6D8C|nr:hypothetical protein [Aequorivita capsosiphonis]